ncbi:helix-turn-helix domain-containing protein [Paracoccus denitrificans]|nr:XRE family transcriptional regulator [Paracoccus denitrificans]QAR26652.1 XRE family transcriptional regulator [Paracoccus denitrificans]UPV95600.1 XRE family transcriptional regulator [Paracoccus denitrificans]WQO32332.1 XRE family transcriptional regulator [Paracoccus denitrificans]
MPLIGHATTLLRIRNEGEGHSMARKIEGTRIQSGLPERLRALRERKGWSLNRAAEEVGVPPSTLSRIENRKMSPTLDLLLKIVRTFDMHPNDVFSGRPDQQEKQEISVSRASDPALIELPNLFYKHLHPDMECFNFRAILITLFARSVEEYGGLTAHSGQEFVYLLSGKLQVHLEGHPLVTLAPGDSIMFTSSIPHAYVSAGDSQAKLLIASSSEEDVLQVKFQK